MDSSSANEPGRLGEQMNQEGLVISQGGWVGFVVGKLMM